MVKKKDKLCHKCVTIIIYKLQFVSAYLGFVNNYISISQVVIVVFCNCPILLYIFIRSVPQLCHMCATFYILLLNVSDNLYIIIIKCATIVLHFIIFLLEVCYTLYILFIGFAEMCATICATFYIN